MADLHVSCACGKIHAVAAIARPTTGHRLVCYCRSCREFATHLGATGMLDECGGSDLFQMPASALRITAGADHIRALRLKPGGLLRWYAGCCDTPMANTVSAKFPFVTLFQATMAPGAEAITGPVRGHVNRRGATAPLPEAAQARSEFGAIARSIRKLLWWKIRGFARPSPLFQEDGTPVREPVIVAS